MKKSFKTHALTIIAGLGLMCSLNHAEAQENMNMDKMKSSDKMKMKDDKMKMKMDMSEMKSWPMSSQMALKEQMSLYGSLMR